MVGQNSFGIPFWGLRCATHFRTYFSGDCIGCSLGTILDFDPWSGAVSHRFFFGWEGSPTKIDYRRKVGALILTSPLEDLGWFRGEAAVELA